VLRHPSLTAVAGLPERLRDLLGGGGGVAGEQRRHPGHQAERCRLPQPVHPGPPLDQQAGDLPAAVADGVVERGSPGDRGAGCLDVGAGIEQRGGDQLGPAREVAGPVGDHVQRRARAPARVEDPGGGEPGVPGQEALDHGQDAGSDGADELDGNGVAGGEGDHAAQ